jgi:hypothetical protein
VAERRDALGVDRVVELVLLVLASREEPVDEERDVAWLIENVSRVGLFALAAVGTREVGCGDHVAVTSEHARDVLDSLTRPQESVAVDQQRSHQCAAPQLGPQPTSTGNGTDKGTAFCM